MRALLVTLVASLLACPRAHEVGVASTASASAPAPTPPPAPAPSPSPAPSPAPSPSPSPTRDPGPFAFEFAPKRRVFVVAARDASKPQRLIAMLHGVCNPPEYACGLWQDAAPDLGFLVCPAGNASCGKAMYDAPTWSEPDAKIDDDLEQSIAKTIEAFPDAIDRTDAVLCGFSKGAYVAVKLAAAHPGRWPYLVLNEANVTLSIDQLQKSKVRAVALIAGEIGGQINGEKATVAKLQKAGFPAKFWPMPKAGHYYSDDIASIMRDAIDFVTSVPAAE